MFLIMAKGSVKLMKYLSGIIYTEHIISKGGTMMSTLFRTEISRGITVALISIGITGAAILPLFLMELLSSII